MSPRCELEMVRRSGRTSPSGQKRRDANRSLSTTTLNYGRTNTYPRPEAAKTSPSGGRQSWSMKFCTLNPVLVLITLRFDWRLRVQTG
jgi:hypothetical protein